MNNKFFAVYDLETDSPDPHTTNIVELSCVIVHPRNLTIVDRFHSMMRPANFSSDKLSDYYKEHASTIEWHADTLKKSVDEVLASWEKATPEDIVWNNFTKFLQKYHENPTRPSKYGCPIAVGYNIVNFDNIIVRRYKEKHKVKYVFSDVFCIDLMQTVVSWFENSMDIDKYKFDVIRDYLGIDKAGAHTAINDTEVFAELFIRFQKLKRKVAPSVDFAGSFASYKPGV